MIIGMPPTTAAAQPISALRFTRAQFYEIVDWLNPDRHYELLNGVILVKPRSNPPHSGTVKFFANHLARSLDPEAYQVQTQDGLEVEPDEAPEPDVCVLAARTDYYSTRHPNGGDVALLIEVSDSERNGQDKMRAYMRDGRIPEAWRIDIPGRCVEIWMPESPDCPTSIYRGADVLGFAGVHFTVEDIPALRPA
jgi:Uma2 family endonuclease